MTKEDVLRKLTSRKFWCFVAAFGVGIYLIISQGCTEELVSGLIMTLGSAVSYIFGEAIVDANRIE